MKGLKNISLLIALNVCLFVSASAQEKTYISKKLPVSFKLNPSWTFNESNGFQIVPKNGNGYLRLSSVENADKNKKPLETFFESDFVAAYNGLTIKRGNGVIDGNPCLWLEMDDFGGPGGIKQVVLKFGNKFYYFEYRFSERKQKETMDKIITTFKFLAKSI
jgi:hypothetical protein